MLIETEATPNPNALKFIPHVSITDGGIYSFENMATVTADVPIVHRLMSEAGITAVLLAPRYLTIRKTPDADWGVLRPKVVSLIAEQIVSGEPFVGATEALDSQTTRSQHFATIDQVFDEHIRPAIAQDGGDVKIVEFDTITGVLKIEMLGACGGCPSASMTLKHGIEQSIRQFAPFVLAVEQVNGQSQPFVPSKLTRKSHPSFREQSGAGPKTVFSIAGRIFRR